MDNLPELRDIHLPTEGVSFLPLAYGWWGILCAIIIFFMVLKLFFVLRRQSKKIYAKYLLNKFAKENTLQAAVAMSEILRRICLKKYPQAVAFSGQEWTDFLLSKTKYKLGDSAKLLLQTAPYRKDGEITDPQIVADLRKFCYAWVGDNL